MLGRGGILAGAAALCLSVMSAGAQTPMERSNLGVPSRIAPAFFGPNAFPVPELPAVSDRLYLEVAGDWYGGSIAGGPAAGAQASDNTEDVFFKLGVPLFSDRVNLTLWGAVWEFWSFGQEVAAARRVGVAGSGSRLGDIYVSTDVMLVRESESCPSLVLRAALKTASGGDFVNARYYDAAGYFFDVTVSKTLRFDGFVSSLALRANAGFLCWQTNNARQNDAVQYGLAAVADSKRATLECFLGGYAGWENCGDRPMVLRARLGIRTGSCASPFVQVQQGLSDYPFTGVRVGCRLDF